MFLDLPHFILLAFSLHPVELSHKPQCVHGGFLNHFSEGPAHVVHHEPKSVIAEHKFSLCKYTWSLSLLHKVSVVSFDLLITYTEAFYQLFVPNSAFIVGYSLNQILNFSQVNYYHSLVRYLAFSYFLPSAFAKPFPLTFRMPLFLLSMRLFFFAFVQNFSVILSLYNLIASVNSKISICV